MLMLLMLTVFVDRVKVWSPRVTVYFRGCNWWKRGGSGSSINFAGNGFWFLWGRNQLSWSLVWDWCFVLPRLRYRGCFLCRFFWVLLLPLLRQWLLAVPSFFQVYWDVHGFRCLVIFWCCQWLFWWWLFRICGRCFCSSSLSRASGNSCWIGFVLYCCWFF